VCERERERERKRERWGQRDKWKTGSEFNQTTRSGSGEKKYILYNETKERPKMGHKAKQTHMPVSLFLGGWNRHHREK